jgi:hypothetical protein
LNIRTPLGFALPIFCRMRVGQVYRKAGIGTNALLLRQLNRCQGMQVIIVLVALELRCMGGSGCLNDLDGIF